MKNDSIKQFVALKNGLRQEKLQIEARLLEINGALSGNSIPEIAAAPQPPQVTKAARKPTRRRTARQPRGKGRTGKVMKALPEPVAAAPAAVSEPKPKTRSAKAVRKAKGARGSRTEKILAVLRSAGKRGITVKELATRTGTHYRNVNAWLSSTAKKTAGVRKLSPGKVAWVG